VKAKAIKSLAERIISMGKKGDLNNRRDALSLMIDEKVVRKVFDDIAGRYNDRPGGYTRILKLGPRKGDGAGMAIIELVESELSSS
jgi:large subunit ribosomal protein L17